MKSPLILIRRPSIRPATGNFSVGLRGRYTAELIHTRTGLIKRRLEFNNLITDAGIDAIVGGVRMLAHAFSGNGTNVGYMEVGTGSTPPAFTDTALESFLAGTSSDGGFAQSDGDASSGNGWVSFVTINRLFSNAAANGNLTEVGIRLGNNQSYPLWSRALFLDEDDNPTTIVKTSEDQLRITYTIQVFAPKTELQQVDFPIVTPANPGGVPTLITNRGLPTNWNSQQITSTASLGLGRWDSGYNTAVGSNVMPSISADRISNALGSDVSNSASWQSYTPGTFYREKEVVFSASAANFAGGIGGISLNLGGSASYAGALVCVFDPKIPKTNIERFVFKSRVQFTRA